MLCLTLLVSEIVTEVLPGFFGATKVTVAVSVACGARVYLPEPEVIPRTLVPLPKVPLSGLQPVFLMVKVAVAVVRCVADR